MKISKRDAGVLLLVMGLLVLVLCYRFIYQTKAAEQKKLNAQLETLQAEEQAMSELAANREFYEQEIGRLTQENAEILARFPADILPENEIMYVVAMEENNDITFSDLAYGSAEELDAGSGSGLTACDVVMTLNYTSTYQGLKDVITYTGGQDRRMVINTVSASYDQSTGNLSGTMTLDQYMVTGTDQVYEAPYVPYRELGTDNIFGTIDLPVSAETDGAADTAEAGASEEAAEE